MIQRPLVCVGVLLQAPDDKLLLVQTTKWRGLWGVAGGKVEWGESLAKAAEREIYEETGLEIFDLQQIQLQEAIFSSEFGKTSHMLLIDFFAQCHHHQVKPNAEISQWAWCSWQEALEQQPKRPLNSYTYNLLRAVQASM